MSYFFTFFSCFYFTKDEWIEIKLSIQIFNHVNRLLIKFRNPNNPMAPRERFGIFNMTA